MHGQLYTARRLPHAEVQVFGEGSNPLTRTCTFVQLVIVSERNSVETPWRRFNYLRGQGDIYFLCSADRAGSATLPG